MARAKTIEARIISLVRSSERRTLIEENLKDFPIRWRFFDALDSQGAYAYAANPANQIDRYGRRLTDGEIGCFKSHISVISEFDHNSDVDWLLVAEDDVWIDVQFDFELLTKFLEERGINYLRLYCRQWKAADVVDTFGERQILRFKTDPYGSQAYLINRTASEAFRSCINSIDRPVDDEYGRFWVNGVDIFAIFPFPVIERSIVSTLLSERDANPMRIANFTLVRHIHRLVDYGRKTKANLAFRIANGRTHRRDR
jgi:glycosyl transferase family 25